jgi:hypothetical protein
MNLTIRPVDTLYISQTWPMVKDYIAESIDKGLVNGSADYTLDHIQAFLTSGQWMLIVAVDEENKIHGAMTLSFINYPLNRVAFVTTTGGKLIINQDTFNQLQSIAKYHGATKIQAMARPAMVKLLQKCDMVPCNTMMEYKL